MGWHTTAKICAGWHTREMFCPLKATNALSLSAGHGIVAIVIVYRRASLRLFFSSAAHTRNENEKGPEFPGRQRGPSRTRAQTRTRPVADCACQPAGHYISAGAEIR